jgi:hypothetical protein
MVDRDEASRYNCRVFLASPRGKPDNQNGADNQSGENGAA